MRLPPSELEAATTSYCEQLVQNNSTTYHFQKLVHHVMELLARADKVRDRAQHAANAVYFLRIFVKHLTENLSALHLISFVNEVPQSQLSNGTAGSHVPLLVQLVRSLVTVLVSAQLIQSAVPSPGPPCLPPPKSPRSPSAASYLFDWEVINLLLVMTSTQLYTPTATAQTNAHPFTSALLQQEDLVPVLLQALLQHFIQRQALPKGAQVYQPPAETPRSVFRLVRSAAATVLWLPLRAYTFLVRSSGAEAPGSPLGDSALLLLLVLLHHAPSAESGQHNSFRRAFAGMQDADDMGSDSAAEAGFSGGSDVAAVSFSGLYEALGSLLNNERTALLLYDALHACLNFQNYVLVRSDLEVLLLPLLHMLYTASGRAPSHLYMLLIILLILTQDASFAANVHKVQLTSVPWYKERLLNRTSLGSLLVVLLLRTAHFNLAKLRDVYLHTNTLAALANLAPHAENLSSHAAQRLVSLFDMLARRYQRLQRVAAGGPGKGRGDELQVYGDFLRIVLEILNCIIVTNLPSNPELVYALLHRQEVFMPFREDMVFAELVDNVLVAIKYFNNKVEAARKEGGWDWSVEKVLEVIKGSMRGWRADKLRRFQELHFTYEEEASPEDFFVPYVWTQVCNTSTIPWNSAAIALFSPLSATMSAASLEAQDTNGLTSHLSASSEVLVANGM
ncbi:g7580 [Coccomyxa elongata]